MGSFLCWVLCIWVPLVSGRRHKYGQWHAGHGQGMKNGVQTTDTDRQNPDVLPPARHRPPDGGADIHCHIFCHYRSFSCGFPFENEDFMGRNQNSQIVNIDADEWMYRKKR